MESKQLMLAGDFFHNLKNMNMFLSTNHPKISQVRLTSSPQQAPEQPRRFAQQVTIRAWVHATKISGKPFLAVGQIQADPRSVALRSKINDIATSIPVVVVVVVVVVVLLLR